MTFRFCDDLGPDGFGWIVDEAMTRTSHALAAHERMWLVDALDWPEAIDLALGLGEPAGVIQLLDRHDRDCAALAERLGVPHVVAPDDVPGSPFSFVPIMRRKRWRETALWWPETKTLVTANALGTNRFYTAGEGAGGRAPVPAAHAAEGGRRPRIGAHPRRSRRRSTRARNNSSTPRRAAHEQPRPPRPPCAPTVRRPRVASSR